MTMNILKRRLLAPAGGIFREFVGVNAFIQPKDVSLYEKLLPKPFAMPDQPVVFIFAADYIKVVPWPMTRYQEWAVLLKSRWHDQEGWYCVTIPVTKWAALMGGRYYGFPKYIADITLARQGEDWIARGIYQGVRQLSMAFHPGITRQLEPWEQVLVSGESFFKGDALLLLPPGKGPRAQRVRLDHVVPQHWSPEPGMVRIEVDPGESWVGLVPAGDSFPGTFNHFTGGFSLVAEER
jgi:hypothetical protein